MVDSLAAAEPYTRSFEATVVERVARDADGSDAPGVVLSETYFYPEGGGQPADRGTIDGVTVTDVQERDGRVVHSLAEPIGAEAGATVVAGVDPAFRTYCMRAHTASHALYGAGRRLFDDLGYGGFDIDERKVRVDLATPSRIDDDALVELERLTNRAVWDSRAVSWERLSREEALSRDEVAFNTKTEEGIGSEAVRIVTIEDWDVAACGGTHVRNTREIGPVSVLDRSNPGEGLTRVEFAVGPAAIDRRTAEKRAALDAASALDTGITGLPEAVERLTEEHEAALDELADLREEVVAARLDGIPAVSRDGNAWLVGGLGLGLDANDLAEIARERAGADADVVALVTEDGSQLAVAAAGETDAGDVVDSVTAEFGGGGGGSPAAAQGGGLSATADEIVAFLRGTE